MKKSLIILTLFLSSFSVFAQDIDLDAPEDVQIDAADSVRITSPVITNKITNKFVISNKNDSLRLLIRDNAEVNWYLSGKDMFIRDGDFQDLGQYDYLHIDGTEGRIGFNILEDELPLTSSIHLHGSIATRVRILDGTATVPYEIKQDDHIMIISHNSNTTSTMELPSISVSRGREYIFKRNGNNTGKIDVKPKSGEKLNGVVNGKITLSHDNSSLEVVCDGTGWWSLSELDVQAAAQPVSITSTLGEQSLIEVKFESDAPIILNLPSAADYDGQEYEIKRNDLGSTYTLDVLTIKPDSGESLDQYTNESPYEMPNDWESVTIRSSGTNWLIISNYGH